MFLLKCTNEIMGQLSCMNWKFLSDSLALKMDVRTDEKEKSPRIDFG